MKDVATTCVFRAVSASKYVCSRDPLGANSAVPDSLAGFGEGRREGEENGMEEERRRAEGGEGKM